MDLLPSIVLKSGREKSLLRRHPWIFSGAVQSVRGDLVNGGTIAILTSEDQFIAWASYSATSQITARVWSWRREEIIDREFFRQRLQRAVAARPNSCRLGQGARLVHGESDELPGLIVDRYDDVAVVQFLTSGVEHWRETLVDLVSELDNIHFVYERSDVDVRQLEGLPERTGPLYGGEPPDQVLIEENDLKFWVDIRRGHKTGFYLDQRKNREIVAELARERSVLDCFCYTGAFSIYAARNGAAEVTSVDASQDALTMAEKNSALNNLSGRIDWQQGDVFRYLREMRDRRREYDLIILDPPKFAHTASQIQQAARGYKDINLLALKLLRPGGILVTFSCSGAMDLDLFQKVIAGAALDAHVQAQVVGYLHQASDHPVALSFPEGTYLKGLLVKVP